MKPELLRGIDEIYGRPELEAALRSKKHKLRIKFGVDLTRPDLHLGHAVGLRKLRQFQDLGHTIIFLLGDYTTKIGDPSGKSKTRPMLNDDEIKTNVATYLDQVGRIIDVKKAEIRYNSEWLSKLTFADLIGLASKMSVAQLIEREDFRNRLEQGQELALHELLYPLMVSYDSVVLEADVEFGGTDQLFNFMAGRALQKKMGQKPQIVITCPLLVGTDGEKKMSKSLDNYIGITEPPIQMYGKVMSIPDSAILPYYELCTEIDEKALAGLAQTLASGANPRDSKASLAREIVRIYHGDDAALAAEASWNQTFRDKSGPTEDQIIELALTPTTPADIIGLMVKTEIATSNGEARRLVDQGGVRLNGAVVGDYGQKVSPGDSLQVGKKRFYRIIKK